MKYIEKRMGILMQTKTTWLFLNWIVQSAFCCNVHISVLLVTELWKKVKVKSLNPVPLLVTPWTVVCQAPPSMGFSRQEYWSGLPFPPPGDLPDPGIKPRSAGGSCIAGRFFTAEPPGCQLTFRFSYLWLFTSYANDTFPRL